MGNTINRDRLKQARNRKLRTQETLAENSGLHPRTIQRIERDGVASVQSCVAIANALEIPVGELQICSRRPIFLPKSSSWITSIIRSVQTTSKPNLLEKIQRIPPALAAVALLWFLGGISDLARGSVLWLGPAFFCIFLSYKLIILSSAWRITALVLNWLFVAAIVLALMIFTLQFIDGNPAKAYVDILENKVFEPYSTMILLYLLSGLMIIVFAWQNSVLCRPDIRRLFNP